MAASIVQWNCNE